MFSILSNRHWPVVVDGWRPVADVVSEPVESNLEASSWQTHWQVSVHCPARRWRCPVTALPRRLVPSASRRSASARRPLSIDAPSTSLPTVSQMTSPTTSLASICSRCWRTDRNVTSCGVSSTYQRHAPAFHVCIFVWTYRRTIRGRGQPWVWQIG